MSDSQPQGAPPPDVAAFEARLRREMRGFFEPGRELFLSRAPGRLDCLGGIIDYCGGTVCEMPLREAVVLALQKRQDRQIRLHSLGLKAEGLKPEVVLSLDDFGPPKAPPDYPAVRAFFRRDPKSAWAGYVAGAFYVLQRERATSSPFRHGANIVLASSVPLGAGVSSSAALEVAAMVAMGAAYGLEWDGLELARLAQKVENQVVGAPCGIMDQVTAALGRENQLLLLECQPCRLLGYAALPEGVQVAALHSGVKHAVGGSKYTDTRIGAFMGHAIILAHLRALGTVAEDPFGGYVCNIPPEEYVRAYRPLVPSQMRGQDFLDRYGGTVDPVTTIDPQRTYRIRSRLEHHIYEQARVQRFRRSLEAYGRTREKVFSGGSRPADVRLPLELWGPLWPGSPGNRSPGGPGPGNRAGRGSLWGQNHRGRLGGHGGLPRGRTASRGRRADRRALRRGHRDHPPPLPGILARRPGHRGPGVPPLDRPLTVPWLGVCRVSAGGHPPLTRGNGGVGLEAVSGTTPRT
jgi:galactokinase